MGQQEGSEGLSGSQPEAFEGSNGHQKGFEGEPIAPVGYKVGKNEGFQGQLEVSEG